MGAVEHLAGRRPETACDSVSPDSEALGLHSVRVQRRAGGLAGQRALNARPDVRVHDDHGLPCSIHGVAEAPPAQAKGISSQLERAQHAWAALQVTPCPRMPMCPCGCALCILLTFRRCGPLCLQTLDL